CSNCRSRNTERPYNNNWSLFHCNDCNITLNSDINASINMAIRTSYYYHGIMLNERQVSFSQLASDEHALTADDNLKKGLSAETHKALELDAQGFLA
ncbi:transposase, partial [Candidatus Woesearchaeota archaeon]|nr:transposase [Candidatus Woesearchaeota archaeon]